MDREWVVAAKWENACCSAKRNDMMKRTPSPRWRQLVIGLLIIAAGWESIVWSIRFDLLLPRSVMLNVAGGLLFILGVAIRIVAFIEIPNTYRIGGS